MSHSDRNTVSPRRVSAAPFLMALLCCLAIAPGALRAQGLIPLSIEEMAAIADDVVHGTVTETASEWHSGKLFTRVQIEVHESFKGEVDSGETLEVATLGGKFGSLRSVVPNSATLQESEEVILFVSKPGERRRRSGQPVNADSPLIQLPQVIGGFQGKFRVVREAEQSGTEEEGARRSETARVMRETSSQRGAPTLEEFSSQLRGLFNDPDRRRSVRSVPTVGAVEVAEPKADTKALRHFDPIKAPQPASLPPNAVLLQAPRQAAGPGDPEPAPADEAGEQP